MDVDKVRGLAVVGLAEARTLGAVEHVYLDPNSRRVVGFGVLPREQESEPLPGALDASGAAFAAPSAIVFLPVEAVRSFGADALMVAAASALDDSDAAEGGGLVALDALDGVDVVDARGESIGHVAAASFDPTSFALTGIEVVQGLLRRHSHIPAALITELGTDRIVANVEGRNARREQRRADADGRQAADTPEPVDLRAADHDATPKNPSRKAPRPPRSERKRRRK